MAGCRWSEAEPEGIHGGVAVSGVGGRYPSELCGLRDGRDEVVIWGTGTPRREFLHVEDMAEASLFVLDLDQATYAANTQPMLSHINVGFGEDVSIGELAHLIAQITGFTGKIGFDTIKPDGTMQKLMDVNRLPAMDWKARIDLERGVRETYQWFLANHADLREA